MATGFKKIEIGILFLIAFCTVAVYYPVMNYDFVSYDDYDYIVLNQNVKTGLSLKNIAWAFKTMDKSSWQPITWISFMVDRELFGMNPGAFHVVNVFFHLLNSLLLFLFFRKVTGKAWESGAISLLFALHPLHVESVAWIAERKDVLSAFFFITAMMAYHHYVTDRRLKYYLAALFLFLFGLMAKPMIVTLPFVMLLLDFWPLNRFHFEGKREGGVSAWMRAFGRLVFEKLPFFLLSMGFAAVTYIAQKQSGAVESLDNLPLMDRLTNAVHSYALYIGKTFWPVKLAVIYPLGESRSFYITLASVILIGCVSLLILKQFQKRPYAFVGWFWFLGTLVPVIGFVQVGSQTMADRYFYIPSIGFFVAILFFISEMIQGKSRARRYFLSFGGVLLFLLSIVSARQVRVWENTETLFSHTLSVTENNYLAHSYLGAFLSDNGKNDDAFKHVTEVERINPRHAGAWYNVGFFYEKQGRIDQAVSAYEKAVTYKKSYKEPWINLGNIYFSGRAWEKAVFCYQTAIEISPDFDKARCNLANTFYQMGAFDEAIGHYRKAVQINRNFIDAYVGLGASLLQKGDIDGAVDAFNSALKIDPENTIAINNLNVARKMKMDLE